MREKLNLDDSRTLTLMRKIGDTLDSETLKPALENDGSLLQLSETIVKIVNMALLVARLQGVELYVSRDVLLIVIGMLAEREGWLSLYAEEENE